MTTHYAMGKNAALLQLGLELELEKEAFLAPLMTAARAGLTAVKASPALANAGRAMTSAFTQGGRAVGQVGKALGQGAQAMKPGLQQAGQQIAGSAVGKAVTPAMQGLKRLGSKAIGALNSPAGQAISTGAMVAPALMGGAPAA